VGVYRATRRQLFAEFPSRVVSVFVKFFSPFVGYAAFGLYVIYLGHIPGANINTGGGDSDDSAAVESAKFAVTLQAVNLIGVMMNGFSALPSYIPTTTEVIALVFRVSQLFDALRSVKKMYEEEAEKENIRPLEELQIAGERPRDLVLKVNNLCFRTPTGKPLFSNLSFELRKGEALLVAGPSGVGKSSLLRCIAGLVPMDSGTIELLGEEDSVMFVPQRQYVTHGSLREQILYPDRPSEQKVSDEELVRILIRLDLAHLLVSGDKDSDGGSSDESSNKAESASAVPKGPTPSDTVGGASSSATRNEGSILSPLAESEIAALSEMGVSVTKKRSGTVAFDA